MKNKSHSHRALRKRIGAKYESDPKYRQNAELTAHRAGLRAKAKAQGIDATKLSYEEFDDIPDITDLEK